MDDSDTLPFIARLTPKPHRLPPEAEPDEAIAPGDAFAVIRGTKAPPALRFLRSDGSLKLAMPYSHPPIVWGESPGLVLLEYPGQHTIILAGKNLGPLESRLCDFRVTWIRECDAAQAALLPTAVTRIERLLRFPSREPDGSRFDR